MQILIKNFAMFLELQYILYFDSTECSLKMLNFVSYLTSDLKYCAEFQVQVLKNFLKWTTLICFSKSCIFIQLKDFKFYHQKSSCPKVQY